MTETKVPAGAKKPADRKPPKPREVDGHMVVTVRGLEVRVPKDALDDLEVVEAIEQNNWLPAMRSLLPPYEVEGDGEPVTVDQVAAVKAALRGENGRVRYSDTVEFLNELMGALAPNS